MPNGTPAAGADAQAKLQVIHELSTRDQQMKLATTLLAAAALMLLAALAGYLQLFSSFAPYDDEGYLMVSLQSYLAGHPLYDATYSQYGPAFYVVNGLFHNLTGLPVTHDVTRLKTLAVWLATAAMGAGLIYRLTRSRGLACLAMLAVFFHLDRLGLEPGHPQDLCLLAISAALLMGTWMGKRAAYVPVGAAGRFSCFTARGNELGSVLLGLLAAVACMTKINIGGLLFAGVGLALLIAAPPSRTRVALLTVFVSGSLSLPWLLARQHAFQGHGFALPVVSSAAIIAALLVIRWASPCRALSPNCCWFYFIGFGGGCFGFAAVALVHGTSLSGLLDGVLWQHFGFVAGFFENPPIYAGAAPAAVIAALAAVATRSQQTTPARLARLGLVVMLVGVCLRQLADSFTQIQHGADDRGQAALLVSFGIPLLWLLFLPYRESESRHDSLLRETYFARLLLCCVALLQPLGVYPVPGTQMALGSLGLLLAVLVCVADILRFPALLGAEKTFFPRALAGGLVSLALLTVVCRDVQGWQQRAALTPMRLHGAERLRLPRGYVAQKQWTVRQLRARADTFICLQNGHNSLYCWSQIAPPTPINTTLWQDLLNDQQQERIVAALATYPRACVVVDHNEPLPFRCDGPLTRYLRAEFAPTARRGAIEIWQRPASGVAMMDLK